MKVVILAGGYGTRLSEETTIKPKPLVEIGGKPILWHIMNIYYSHGFNEFMVALGYKGEMIKRFFTEYYNMQSNLVVSLKTGKISASKKCSRDWTVHLIDTGIGPQTGGRLYRLRDSLKNEAFMFTYGDGVSNIDITKLLKFHKSHGKIATVSAVRPSARFGGMKFDGNHVTEFTEKPQTGEGRINGGFFVFEPRVFEYLQGGDNVILEEAPLENLAADGELMAYKHDDFWQCMDTLRDKHLLEKLWISEKCPWKSWKD